MRPSSSSVLALAGALALLSAACAPRPERETAPRVEAAPSPSLASVRLEGIPHVEQRPDFCGEACLEMAARARGSDLDQDDAFAFAAVDPSLGRGAVTRELAAAALRMGFRTGPVWSELDAAEGTRGLEPHFAALHRDLERGVPSIVCMRWSDDPQPEHFRLVVGYDAERDAVLYHEPAEADGAYRAMPRTTFLERWPLRYAEDRHTLVRIALEPGPDGLAPPPARARGPSVADLAQQVRAVRERLPPGFTVRVEAPFVVVGDDAPAVVERHATGTVRWAVERLERDFFDARPSEPLVVWLFRDDASYERHVRALTGEAPSTPYGFYSSTHGGLFMNIATGGGTLVHEIVHPFVEADLPGAPSWVNEGLGSLFEQSADRGGHIVGLTNWRLTGLQRAIRRRELGSFERLAKTTSRAFYEDDRGTNYAQARYLLLWLQEQGKLPTFWRQLRRDLPRDPTGWTTLVQVLGESDMAAFQERWEAWVLGLRFP